MLIFWSDWLIAGGLCPPETCMPGRIRARLSSRRGGPAGGGRLRAPSALKLDPEVDAEDLGGAGVGGVLAPKREGAVEGGEGPEDAPGEAGVEALGGVAVTQAGVGLDAVGERVARRRDGHLRHAEDGPAVDADGARLAQVEPVRRLGLEVGGVGDGPVDVAEEDLVDVIVGREVEVVDARVALWLLDEPPSVVEVLP